MLFQGLSAPDDGVYVAQTVCKLPLDVDLRAFEQAWRSVINRHDILRTCFLWQGLSEPLQKVCEGISVPIEIQDWASVPATDQDDLLQSLLLRERKRGFNFSTAPLMRITLLKLAGDEHLFLWTHHHILLDGRSRLIVMKEVSLFYEAYRRNQNLELPPPPSYADYVDWFYRQDQSDAEQYWWNLLETFRTPTKLELPWESDAGQSGERYQTVHFSLPAEVKDSLQLLAQSKKLTINWIVQAAWAVLLSRYSGQEDVVFGETRSGRRTDFESVGSVVGLLINTVPIRLHVEGRKTFLNLLQELRDQHVAMRSYECTPLTRIRAGSGLDRAAELFQSLVAFDEYSPGSGLQREGCELWSGGVSRRCPVHYPLAVAGFSKPDLSLRVEYDRRSYSDEAVGRLVGHLATLLEEAIRDPYARIADLPLLTDTEQQALKQWNRTAVDYAADACVHLLVEKQVTTAPDAVAVVFEGDVLTYAELNRRANQLAHYLRRLGVGPDARVAICAERSLEMITGLLGTLKAGGAYVPLDPAYPAERLRYMLEDSAPLVVLTQAHLRNLFAGIGEELPVLNLAEAALWAGSPDMNPKRADVGHSPANLAYVIYTSGSTGAPKGVAIEHRSLLNLICWTRKSFEIERGVRSSSVAGFGFDAFTWEVWPALCAGATLLLPPPMVARDPEALLAWWESKEPEISFLPTPIAELAFAQGITNARQRILYVGGDVLRRLPAQVSPFMLVNNYGPTEATVVATSGPVEDNAIEPTIGRPIANTQIYILDQHRQPVPMGVAGELYIGGAGVGRGYLGRPEQTAERFLADPFVESSGRMYRSGDLARWREDGRIEFLGRDDFQVKIRGYRIELGEIEARLAEHAGVGEVVVMARENTVGDKRLVAYYTPVEANGEGLGAEELRAYLGDKLPEYMLPTAYVRLERLPLTPNGKVDRQALPAPQGDAYVAREYEVPVGESETALAKIWA
ncbi:MAG TPA: amino acid adenylation domain-containing protein, partial [Blastocatellia bacterium]|nr:amino acid adenylation domain-containing protein [Blastocatellia bacterium]